MSAMRVGETWSEDVTPEHVRALLTACAQLGLPTSLVRTLNSGIAAPEVVFNKAYKPTKTDKKKRN